MDEQLEEQAASYAVGAMEGGELQAFETRLASDPALARAVDEFREAAAKFALAARPRLLPTELEGRILSEIRGSKPRKNSSPSRSNSWLPWAIAACLALACGALVMERARLQKRLVSLQTRDTLAQMRIANLASQLASSPKATAVVIWDSEKQEGVLKVLDVPPAGQGRDYQLWIVDPQYGQPVDAGVFDVAEQSNVTQIAFKPKSRVGSVKAFAVSLERKGGVPKAEGPMVLVGQ